MTGATPSLRVIGPGRAGRSVAKALSRSGWQIKGLLGRGDDLTSAAADVDLLLIATPDAVVSEVSAAVTPNDETVVAHLSGSLGLAALGTHSRRCSFHPLVSLPNEAVGADRLAGAWFALAGDPFAERVVANLGGRPFRVADEDRAKYHAAAAIASNHLVAMFAQVERIASSIGVPLEAYLELAQTSLDNVARMGTAAALTGPVARGDWETVRRHVEALPSSERAAYLQMASEARRLVDNEGLPPDLEERR